MSDPQQFQDRRRTPPPCQELQQFAGEVRDELARGSRLMGRLETAMFAPDAQNEFETPGVMTVLQKINRHVDMVCGIADLLRRAVNMGKYIGGAIIVLGGAYVAGQQMGWW